MKKPVLVIMAAGMGSRYGGLKQIDPVDNEGHIIMDFSIYDAKRAGFEKVVFIIKKAIEKEFKAGIGDRISQYMDVEYVYQELDTLPEGFEVPEGRVKPFGTGHAILSCKDVVDGPFAVINADDYYGVHAFQEIYNYLTENEDDEKYHYALCRRSCKLYNPEICYKIVKKHRGRIECPVFFHFFYFFFLTRIFLINFRISQIITIIRKRSPAQIPTIIPANLFGCFNISAIFLLSSTTFRPCVVL